MTEIFCHACSKSFSIRTKGHKFLLKNPDQKFFCSRSCSCTHSNRTKPRVMSPEVRAKAVKSYIATCEKRPPAYLRVIFKLAKRRATKLNREFSITLDDVLQIFKVQDGKCAYTGWPLDISRNQTGRKVGHETRIKHASLDRLDNTKGYVLGNVQMVCARVNLMKSTLNEHEFIGLCKAVAQKF